jgi:hypothetical protein
MSTLEIDTVPELTKYVVTANFTDEDGEPATPTAASYRLVDATTDADIIPTTALVVSGPTVIITIPANKNTCQTPGTRTEYKQLIITATDLAQVEHLYRVKRVPAP